MSRIARRRASFASRSLANAAALAVGPCSSGSLQDGHRFANPGLPGFSSNSLPQTAQTLIGNAISSTCFHHKTGSDLRGTSVVPEWVPARFPGISLSLLFSLLAALPFTLRAWLLIAGSSFLLPAASASPPHFAPEPSTRWPPRRRRRPMQRPLHRSRKLLWR